MTSTDPEGATGRGEGLTSPLNSSGWQEGQDFTTLDTLTSPLNSSGWQELQDFTTLDTLTSPLNSSGWQELQDFTTLDTLTSPLNSSGWQEGEDFTTLGTTRGMTLTSTLLGDIAPILISFLGTMGNFVSLVVLVKLKHIGGLPFLRALAVSDTLYVWFSRVTFESLEVFWGYKPNAVSNVTCKVWAFLSWVPSGTSAWFVVAVTIERLLAVTQPFKVKIICNTRCSLRWIVLIVAAMSAIKCHTFFTYEIQEYKNKPLCYFAIEGKYVSIYLFFWMMIYSVVPSIVILTCNITTMIKIKQHERRHRTLTNGPIRSAVTIPRRMTGMFLLVSIMFLVTSLPLALTWWLNSLFSKDKDILNNFTDYMYLSWLLMLLNHSMNFLLYVISGRLFRNKLADIFTNGVKLCKLSKCVRRSRSEDVAQVFVPANEGAVTEQNFEGFGNAGCDVLFNTYL